MNEVSVRAKSLERSFMLRGEDLVTVSVTYPSLRLKWTITAGISLGEGVTGGRFVADELMGSNRVRKSRQEAAVRSQRKEEEKAAK